MNPSEPPSKGRTLPPEVHRALLEILREGILLIRLDAAGGRATKCDYQADHLHHIPDILLSEMDGALAKPDAVSRLKFYFTTVRETYLRQKPEEYELAQYDGQWNTLRVWLASHRAGG
jgi:hypothetical protein